MNQLQWIRQLYSHRFFKRILLFSIATLILLVLIASTAFYIYIGDNVTKNKYEADMRMLLQIEKNFKFINTLLVNYCIKIAEDPDALAVMRAAPGEMNRFTIDTKLRNLSTDMASYTPYIHSIQLYNNQARTYYAAYTNATGTPIDVYLANTINVYEPVPKLIPVLRKIRSNTPDTVSFQDVLSYFHYDHIDADGYFVDAVVLNVDPTWLLDNLYSLNVGEDDLFLLMTSNREFVSYSENIPYNCLDDVKYVYYSHILQNLKGDPLPDMVSCKLGGEQYMLSYIYMPDEEFILYKLESYESVYSEVNRVKNMVLIISAAIIFIALLLAFFLARRIYTPFDDLVKRVRLQTGGGNPATRQFDELGFLQDSYASNVNEISLLRSEVDATDRIRYKYYLSQLLVNSTAVNTARLSDMDYSGLLHISLNNPLLLVLLRLNGDMNDAAVSSASARLASIFTEYLDSCPAHDVIDLENGSIVALVNHADSTPDSVTNDILTAIQETRRHMLQRFGATLVSVVSNPVYPPSKISTTYLDMQRSLRYSYVFGSSTTITSHLIAEAIDNHALNYPLETEQKLVAAIREKNATRVEALLDQMIEAFKRMSYNNMMVSLVNLCNTVRITLNEYNKANLKSEYIDMFAINPMEYNTIDELRLFVLDLIKSCFATDVTQEKHKKIIDITRKTVAKCYADPNLSLISIADLIKISPNYLNYTFKNMCGLSVSDYIMDYRLDEAAKLIQTTSKNIATVMSCVGIENESTFYRRFKAKFGVTPKNYVLNSY